MGRAIRCTMVLLALALAACRGATAQTEEFSGPSVLDYNFGANPTALDPHLAEDRATVDIMAQLFEGLTRFDSQRAAAMPALAVAWDVSGDGLTYTFKMREDALWVNQQGEPVRPVAATDIVYSIRRACSPDVQAPSSHILYAIEGCREVKESAGIPDLESIGVRAQEPSVVEFTLVRPAAYFPVILAMPVAWPVPQEAVESEGALWTEPEKILTNSAFLLDSLQPGEQLTLIRNPHYYNVDEVAISQVNGYLEDDEQALDLYLAGQLDTVVVTPSQMEQVSSIQEQAGRLTRIPEPCTYAYGFTTIKAPTDNVRVRRALSWAIDRAGIVESVRHGSGLPARHFAPPIISGVPSLESSTLSFDLQKGQDLLAAAGYPGGHGFPALTLMHPTGAEQEAIAVAVAGIWKEQLGVEVELQPRTMEDYLDIILGTKPLEEVPHIWVLSWCSSYPDEHDWVHEIFNVSAPVLGQPPLSKRYAERITMWGGQNAVRRVPGRFDELTVEAAGLDDAARRQALYAEAESILVLEDAVITPLFHHTTDVLTQPWLERTFSSIGGQSFKDWRIDMAAKERASGMVGEEGDR